jgi:UTP-glucose-1-phosphate uridylyltransferase
MQIVQLLITASLSSVFFQDIFYVRQQPILGLGRLTVEVSRSHTDPHPVELLSSDQLIAKAATHTTRNKHRGTKSV